MSVCVRVCIFVSMLCTVNVKLVLEIIRKVKALSVLFV